MATCCHLLFFLSPCNIQKGQATEALRMWVTSTWDFGGKRSLELFSHVPSFFISHFAQPDTTFHCRQRVTVVPYSFSKDVWGTRGFQLFGTTWRLSVCSLPLPTGNCWPLRFPWAALRDPLVFSNHQLTSKGMNVVMSKAKIIPWWRTWSNDGESCQSGDHTHSSGKYSQGRKQGNATSWSRIPLGRWVWLGRDRRSS